MSDPVCRHKVPVEGHPNQLRWCGNQQGVEEIPDLGPRCPHHSPPRREKHPHGHRIRAVIEADKLTLTRDERHELAAYLVGHEGSWSTLPEDKASRIADALKGFLVIQALFLIRRQNRGGS